MQLLLAVHLLSPVPVLSCTNVPRRGGRALQRRRPLSNRRACRGKADGLCACRHPVAADVNLPRNPTMLGARAVSERGSCGWVGRSSTACCLSSSLRNTHKRQTHRRMQASANTGDRSALITTALTACTAMAMMQHDRATDTDSSSQNGYPTRAGDYPQHTLVAVRQSSPQSLQTRGPLTQSLGHSAALHWPCHVHG